MNSEDGIIITWSQIEDSDEIWQSDVVLKKPKPEILPKKKRGRPCMNKVPKAKFERTDAYYSDGKFDMNKYSVVNKDKLRTLASNRILCSCSMWIRRDKMTGHKKKSRHEQLSKMLESNSMIVT
jgi:hypothetical protein